MRYLSKTLLFAACLSSASVYAAEPTQIENIRQQYENLRYKACNFDPQEIKQSSSGLESVAFKDKSGQVQMLKVTAISPTEQNVKEFYYENNALIFVKEKTERYNSSFYGSAAEAKAQGLEAYDPLKTITKENYYFFADNQLLAWEDQSKQAIDKKSLAYQQQAEALIAQSNQLLVQATLN
jgi:hypothetical protein